MTLVTTYDRKYGCPMNPQRYRDHIVTDGRRRWCVTVFDGGVVVRRAWGMIPYGRPMRTCGLRSRILGAVSSCN